MYMTESELKLEHQVIFYSESIFEEKKFTELEDCLLYKELQGNLWINIESNKHVEIIESLSKKFRLHPLTIEDIFSVDQRPKLDDYEDQIFIVIKMLSYDEATNTIETEQLSLILGKNYLVSIQESDKEGDVFNSIREKLRGSKGKIRKMGADYLLYSLIDMVVDNYFNIIEKIGEKVEEIESNLITDPTSQTLRRLYALKRELVYLRKSVWPLREVIAKLERLDSDLVQDATVLYIKDVYDHTVQVIETIESYRELLAGLLDIYLSSISNRLNSVMKVLTIISTIFMPLSFVVGLYGMNFEYIPELKWQYGYYMVIGICCLISLGMLYFFRKRRWI
ncbi:MAG: magnesium and cobalt transport protein CorA [Cytophagales bacterium]|nr:MAG: magnesium and cobalt transport protein CorA [Cytophagales bacterium]